MTLVVTAPGVGVVPVAAVSPAAGALVSETSAAGLLEISLSLHAGTSNNDETANSALRNFMGFPPEVEPMRNAFHPIVTTATGGKHGYQEKGRYQTRGRGE